MKWNAGYVAETTYTAGYYYQMNPELMNYHLIIRGKRPIDLDSEFSYCELACGQGLTTNMLAIMYPQGRFYANDFNPDHIASCRSFAEKCGITNVTFSDLDFIDYNKSDEIPKEFDFISLHGIYSWISAENQRAIIQFIRDRLKVGGVVYISYNAMPGWAPILPMQRFLLSQGRNKVGTIYERFDYAYQTAKRFAESSGIYFLQPQVQMMLTQMGRHDPSYLVHEYFNEHWQAMYFEDVYNQLREAKVSFLCSAREIHSIEAAEVTPEGLKALEQYTDPIQREQVKDFLVNRRFREDIYIKGSTPLTPDQYVELVSNYRVMLISPASGYKPEFSTGYISGTLGTDYEKIIKLCDRKPITLGEIAQKLEANISQVASYVLFLAGLGYLTLFRKPNPANTEQRKRYNQMSLNQINMPFLICPNTNSVIMVNNIIHKMFITQKKPSDIAKICQAMGFNITVNETVKEGDNERIVQRPLETEKELLEHLEKMFEEYKSEWAGIYQSLGF